MNAHANFDNWFNATPLPEDVDFIPGDIVTLLTGSPLMTVLSVCEHGCVEVAWYDDHKGMNIDAYPEEALVHWDGSDD